VIREELKKRGAAKAAERALPFSGAAGSRCRSRPRPLLCRVEQLANLDGMYMCDVYVRNE